MNADSILCQIKAAAASYCPHGGFQKVDRDDLVQRAALRILKRRKNFPKEPEDISQWIRMQVHQAFCEALAAHYKQQCINVLEVRIKGLQKPKNRITAYDTLNRLTNQGTQACPREALMERERHVAMSEATNNVLEGLAAMNPIYRAVLELRLFQALRIKECARSLSISESKFRSLYRSALDQARKLISKDPRELLAE